MFNHTPATNVTNVGTQYVFSFSNGYGASVIDYGYGSQDGLYELAVTLDGDLCYDTVITDDVIGHLSVQDVNDTLDRIATL